MRMLAETTPTRFIAFDLLAEDDEVLLELPQRERRDRLEARVDAPVDLTPATEDPEEAAAVAARAPRAWSPSARRRATAPASASGW